MSSLSSSRMTGSSGTPASFNSPQTSNTLPVFVFPSSLSFYADDSSSFKQILTLYNPYDFGVRFKVFSTAPHKYTVVDPEGVIKPRCYVDIVVRINDVSSPKQSRPDEFRICMYQMSNTSSSSSPSSSNVSGHRDVTATLYPSKPSSHSISSPDGSRPFEAIPHGTSHGGLTQSQIFSGDIDSPLNSSSSLQDRRQQLSGQYNNPYYRTPPNYFLILLSVAAAVVLMMPNSEEEKPALLSFLPLPGIHVKLCAAYVLGCVTKPLFWP